MWHGGTSRDSPQSSASFWEVMHPIFNMKLRARNELRPSGIFIDVLWNPRSPETLIFEYNSIKCDGCFYWLLFYITQANSSLHWDYLKPAN